MPESSIANSWLGDTVYVQLLHTTTGIYCVVFLLQMPRVARLRTLIAKAVGVMFSVGGGLNI